MVTKVPVVIVQTIPERVPRREQVASVVRRRRERRLRWWRRQRLGCCERRRGGRQLAVGRERVRLLVQMAAARIEAQHHEWPSRRILLLPFSLRLLLMTAAAAAAAGGGGGGGGAEPEEVRVAGGARRRLLGHDVGGRDGRGVARVLVRVGDPVQWRVVVVLLLHQLGGKALSVLTLYCRRKSLPQNT
uniref:Uncharacterized protein n=1 Tax=Oryza meridionalis TaxID=40149 RepID=A0A0E0C9J4_9ORYZ